MWRTRIGLSLIAGVVIAVGLLSRTQLLPWPAVIAAYAGDTLWALLVFLLLRIMAPQRSIVGIGLVALLLATGVEVSQVFHPPWLDALRSTPLGRLVLGDTFVGSDLVCYAIGISSGVLIAWGLQQWQRRRARVAAATRPAAPTASRGD